MDRKNGRSHGIFTERVAFGGASAKTRICFSLSPQVAIVFISWRFRETSALPHFGKETQRQFFRDANLVRCVSGGWPGLVSKARKLGFVLTDDNVGFCSPDISSPNQKRPLPLVLSLTRMACSRFALETIRRPENWLVSLRFPLQTQKRPPPPERPSCAPPTCWARNRGVRTKRPAKAASWAAPSMAKADTKPSPSNQCSYLEVPTRRRPAEFRKIVPQGSSKKWSYIAHVVETPETSQKAPKELHPEHCLGGPWGSAPAPAWAPSPPPAPDLSAREKPPAAPARPGFPKIHS